MAKHWLRLVSALLLTTCALVTTAFSPNSRRSCVSTTSRSGDRLLPTSSGTALFTEASSSPPPPSLTLYGHPGTRSPLVNWACHELGVTFAMGDLSQNPHPFGQLPCLTASDGALLFESGAILQYLNFEYASEKLTSAQQAAVISFITWANASLDPICFKETPEGKVYDTGLKASNKRLQTLENMLSKQEYLVDDAGFTLADVAVASYLLYVVQFFPDVSVGKLYPNITKYMERCASREAYAEAFGERVQKFVLSKLAEEPPKKLFGVF